MAAAKAAAKKAAPKSTAQTLADLAKNRSMRVGLPADFADEVAPRPWDTCNLALNALSGIDGFPRGRVIELFGPFSSGKTTASAGAMRGMQEEGRSVMFLDYEGTFDEKYMQALGVDTTDPERFFYGLPDTFEDGANAFRSLLRAGDSTLGLLVVDSVARMTTQRELDALTGQAGGLDRAKMMAQFLRQVTRELLRRDCGIIFLNHEQEVVDMSGNPAAARFKQTTTPGGKALKFYASLRVQFQQVGSVRSEVVDPLTGDKKPVQTATKVRATAVKNKVGVPFRQAEMRVRWGRGFSQEWAAFDVLRSYKGIRQEVGGKYRISDPDVAVHAVQTEALTEAGIKVSEHKSGDPTFTGEDNLIRALELVPAFRAAAIRAARLLVEQHGWERSATADELAGMDVGDGSADEVAAETGLAPEEVGEPVDAMDPADLDSLLSQTPTEGGLR